MKRLFNLKFIEGCKEDVINRIISEKKSIIFTPNIDHIIKIKEDHELYEKYSKANFIIADGWPIAMSGKIKKLNINRITGVDLMESLLQYADNNSKKVFFLGAEDETLEKLKINIQNKYHNIGRIETNHGFFDNDEIVINKINKSDTDILFVGMGCPKQEKWIIDNKDKLNARIMIGIGGALKIYSGEVTRAPKIVQSLGIEWFYRFMKEPRRLFRRYFIEYFKFVPILFNEVLNKKEVKYGQDFNH